MNFRPDVHRQLRFARNLDEALRTPRWATAVHGPYLSPWKRILYSFVRWL